MAERALDPLLDHSIARRAARFAALGDPHRLAIVEDLRLSDRSPTELAATLGLGSNLLAHHLSVLETAGLVTRVASHGDGRRRYIRLVQDAITDLMPAPRIRAGSVLFVCRHNAARSQLAVALWRERSNIPAESAGSEPGDRVHSAAFRVAENYGLRLGDDARPRGYLEVEASPDLVISVCDVAGEAGLPFADARHLHWSVPDPSEGWVADGAGMGVEDASGVAAHAGVGVGVASEVGAGAVSGGGAGSQASFESVFQILRARVDGLAPLVVPNGQ